MEAGQSAGLSCVTAAVCIRLCYGVAVSARRCCSVCGPPHVAFTVEAVHGARFRFQPKNVLGGDLHTFCRYIDLKRVRVTEAACRLWLGGDHVILTHLTCFVKGVGSMHVRRFSTQVQAQDAFQAASWGPV